MMSPEEQLAKVAKSQSRLQIALIVVSVVLVATLIVTWKSLTAMHEANALQREQFVHAKTGTRTSSSPDEASRVPRARAKASPNSETHTSSSGKERTGEREAATPGAAGTTIASARVHGASGPAVVPFSGPLNTSKQLAGGRVTARPTSVAVWILHRILHSLTRSSDLARSAPRPGDPKIRQTLLVTHSA